MLLTELLSKTPSATSHPNRRAATREPLGSVTQRLDSAEQQLRIQFIRIAQLQAQLDVVMGMLRRSSDEMRVR